MIIALDVGTSSARAAVYDQAGRALDGAAHQVHYEPTATPDGGMEHEAGRLLDAVVTCLDAIHAAHRSTEFLGVGVATFWHGLLGFDGTGHPVTPIFMWADSRSGEDAARLRSALDETALHARTGCPLHSSYWPAKLRWLARERPDDWRRITRWGSFGEYLELSLFGEAATSISTASATGLFDQARGAWDPRVLAVIPVEERRLFPLVDRDQARRGLRAPWADRWPALARVPWFPAIGDGAAGNIGSDCTDPGRMALNVGTSAALRVVTADPPAPPAGLWRYRVDRNLSIVGGATSEGGNVFGWCRRVLRLPEAHALEAALAPTLANDHGLIMLPFLAGERAPRWREDRTATITGLRITTDAIDILRAALEAVALRLKLIHDLVTPWATRDHLVIAAGGALAGSRAWTQIIADVLGRPVTWSPESEATSRGVARLTLHALGILPDLAAEPGRLGETFQPDARRHAHYKEALARHRDFDDRV